MPIVPAQCTNCGGLLQIDSSKDAAICPFCGTPYIVEKAINNYRVNNKYEIHNAQINVFGEDIEKMVADADALLYQLGETDQAFEKYKEISERHPRDYRGWWGMAVCKMRKGFYDEDYDSIGNNIAHAKQLHPQALNYFNKIWDQYNSTVSLINEKLEDNDSKTIKINQIESRKASVGLKPWFVGGGLFILTCLLIPTKVWPLLIISMIGALLFIGIGIFNLLENKTAKEMSGQIEQNNEDIKQAKRSFSTIFRQICKTIQEEDNN